MASPERLRARMVERQIAARGIDDARILSAFREVPRENFIPDDMAEFAYEDRPLPIGGGQTISQPYIVACMIDAAEIAPGAKVLEVGAGSGYAAAVTAQVAGEGFAIERFAVLASAARERVEKLGYANCHVLAGDGMQGLPGEAPFDAVLVAARGLEVPDALKRQLRIGGRLVIPVGGEEIQQLECVTRTGEETWEPRTITQVRFVPLLAGEVPETSAGAAAAKPPCLGNSTRSPGSTKP